MGNKGLRYIASFKLQGVQYAEKHGKDLQVVNFIWTNSALGDSLNQGLQTFLHAGYMWLCITGRCPDNSNIEILCI